MDGESTRSSGGRTCLAQTLVSLEDRRVRVQRQVDRLRGLAARDSHEELAVRPAEDMRRQPARLELLQESVGERLRARPVGLPAREQEARRFARVESQLADQSVKLEDDSLDKRLNEVRNYYGKLATEAAGNATLVAKIKEQQPSRTDDGHATRHRASAMSARWSCDALDAPPVG